MSDTRPTSGFSDDYHDDVFRDGKLVGDAFDVSEEAVRRATARSNRIRFYRADSLGADFAP